MAKKFVSIENGAFIIRVKDIRMVSVDRNIITVYEHQGDQGVCDWICTDREMKKIKKALK